MRTEFVQQGCVVSLASDSRRLCVLSLFKGDGKLSQEELRPQFGGPGGGQGGQRGLGGPGGQDGADEQDLAQRIMAMDKNGDGKVEKRELPGRMSRLLERADTDKDGAIDEQEARTVSDELQRRGQRPSRPKRPAEE